MKSNTVGQVSRPAHSAISSMPNAPDVAHASSVPCRHSWRHPFSGEKGVANTAR